MKNTAFFVLGGLVGCGLMLLAKNEDIQKEATKKFEKIQKKIEEMESGVREKYAGQS